MFFNRNYFLNSLIYIPGVVENYDTNFKVKMKLSLILVLCSFRSTAITFYRITDTSRFESEIITFWCKPSMYATRNLIFTDIRIIFNLYRI